MKIMAKFRAYFNGEVIKPGEIIDINSEVVPTWATVLEPSSGVKEKPKKARKVQKQTEDLYNKTEAELYTILDELLTKALEQNIMIEDADKKSPMVQIKELRAKLG